MKEFTELENQQETTMKKLMIAAAAAAMVSGVYAGNCEPESPATPTGSAAVYSVKMTVKTTKGTAVAGTTVTKGSQCTPDEKGSTCFVYREKDSTVFQGYIYDCSDTCDLLETGSQVFWDSKRKTQLANGAITTTLLNVMGKKQTVGEWAWTFAGKANYGDDASGNAREQEYTLTGAGYGVYNTKNERFTSFSGNFAGYATPSYDLKSNSTKISCACDPSQVWKCTALDTPADNNTVAFGTWTAKYDASASKKLYNKGVLTVPSYVAYEPAGD